MAAVAPGAATQVPTTPDTTLRAGQFVQRTQSSAPTAKDFETDEEFSATYVSADVKIVINEILGEFLGIDYSIAPDVSGSVTMRVDGLRSRLSAIEVLRSALQPLGIAVVDRGDFVAITRGSGRDGPAQAHVIDPGQPSPPGGGVVVLATKNISPTQLAPLLAPFAPSANISMVDDVRRFLILRGDEASITAASAAAAMFDVDWFRQISVGSFQLKHISAPDVIPELKSVLGPTASTAEFIAIPRLSKLLVLARRPNTLAEIQNWLDQLDTPSADIAAGILVYRAQHLSAEELAQSLRGSGIEDSAPSAPAPASPPVQGAPTGQAGSPPQAAPGAATAPRSLSVSTSLSQNAVIVRGDPDQIAEARALLQALDQQPAQVLIEAAIVEVTLNDDLQYGVNWRGLQDRLTATFTDSPTGDVTSRFPGLALVYVNTDIEAALNLLASITKVEVVSRPSVMALNNQSAELQVGDQVPIVTQSAVSVTDPGAPIVNQTTYRDTGVILTVTPRVRAAGAVEIEVEQEVSQVAKTTSSGIDSPTFQQRRLQSRLLIPSGKSVALGGLISSRETKGVTGVPILKDIPLLGQLFRTDSRFLERTELLVFLTPRVFESPAQAVSATENLRQAFRKLEAEVPSR